MRAHFLPIYNIQKNNKNSKSLNIKYLGWLIWFLKNKNVYLVSR